MRTFSPLNGMSVPLFFFFLLFLSFPIPAQEKGDLEKVLTLQKRISDVIQKGSAAYLSLEGGSGVLISPSGEVLTNYHVVAKRKVGETWYVMDPQRKIHLIKMVGIDAWGDLALLKLQGASPYPFVPLAPDQTLKKGDPVVALGNPFSLSRDGRPSASLGIVSALNLHEYNYPLAIQTDAAVNPGNSGGPLLNLKGEVVGITGKISARFGSGINTGVGYAIPAEQIRRFLPALRKGGEVYHGTLEGLFLNWESQPVEVQKILPDSPGAARNFQEGDILLELNGTPIIRALQFWNILHSHPEKTALSLTLKRAGKVLKLKVELDRYTPPTGSEKGKKPYLGIRIELKGKRTFEIIEVVPYSPADRAGLEKGDLLLKVDGKSFQTRETLGQYISSKKVGEEIRLLLRKENRVVSLTITLRAKD